ncbi:hypothetical protein [Myceligenerans crystallogenes]|uniref:Suppressor of fused protein (SUFU) n=1 Tax=Myceligenerans crystallogenes TaxID=316335 RepID=A0ABN2N7V2_9MICO
MSTSLDEYNEATHDALHRAWSGWGTVDEHVIAHLISPEFLGGPRWPSTRQAHVVVRRDGELLVASDGLADPMEWEDGGDPPVTNGFGVEVYAMSGDEFEDTSVEAIPRTWLGMLLMGVSSTVAQNGPTFARMLQAEGTITVAFGADALPAAAHERYVDGDGLAVVLLGATGKEIPDTVDGPLSPIRLVNAKLLTAAEGAFCVQDGRGSRESREELVRRFHDQGAPLHSSLTRDSVVG